MPTDSEVTREKAWDVHNHGPEEGEGLYCRESLIGACVKTSLSSDLASLQAERDGLLEVIARTKRHLEMAVGTAVRMNIAYSILSTVPAPVPATREGSN